MIRFLKRNIYIVFGFLFTLTVAPFFTVFFEPSEKNIVKDELYNPKLAYLNSNPEILNYVDSIYDLCKLNRFDTALYVQTLSKVVKERFRYGVSHYKVSENWIAYALGKTIWPHFSAVVIPNDILKNPDGLCSQQTIVFMEILKKHGVNVRSVGLGLDEGPGHFLCEVHYNGIWRLHDVTLEPQWLKIDNAHQSMDYYMVNKDSLYKIYSFKMSYPHFNKLIRKVKYGKVNEFPAKNMRLFHQVTSVFVYLLPVFFLILFLRELYLKKKKINNKSI